MNLEQFVNRKVTVILRNGFIETGTLLRSPYSLDYPYIFKNNFYTRRGEILIDKLSKYDIISIQLTEEPKMTDPDYKELATELYDAFKNTYEIYGNINPKQSAILEKYKNLHKPKLTYVSCIAGDQFVYDGKDYALIGRFWHRIQRSMLTFVEDDVLAEELITAYSEWEKTKSV